MSTKRYSEEQMRTLAAEARAMVEEVSGVKRRPLGTPSTEASALREELDITDKLLNSQYELIDLIPPCPEHGSRCLPHAKAWVQARSVDAERYPMPVRVAASILGGAFAREPFLAQHWHVALVTEIMLEGAPADSANAAASRFMKAAFGVTTS